MKLHINASRSNGTAKNNKSGSTRHIKVTRAWDNLIWNDDNFVAWALRRDCEYAEWYEGEGSEVECNCDVTSITYNPRYKHLTLTAVFTVEFVSDYDGKYKKEEITEKYKFPITEKATKLLREQLGFA